MGSRANKENVQTSVRRTTVGQDVKEIGERAGRLVGGFAGQVRDTIKAPERKRRIDQAIEDAGG